MTRPAGLAQPCRQPSAAESPAAACLRVPTEPGAALPQGDYHRYLAEFKTGTERKEAAEHTLLAYKAAQARGCRAPAPLAGPPAAAGERQRFQRARAAAAPPCRPPAPAPRRTLRWWTCPPPTPSAWAWRSTSASSTTRSSTRQSARATWPSRRAAAAVRDRRPRRAFPGPPRQAPRGARASARPSLLSRRRLTRQLPSSTRWERRATRTALSSCSSCATTSRSGPATCR